MGNAHEEEIELAVLRQPNLGLHHLVGGPHRLGELVSGAGPERGAERERECPAQRAAISMSKIEEAIHGTVAQQRPGHGQVRATAGIGARRASTWLSVVQSGFIARCPLKAIRDAPKSALWIDNRVIGHYSLRLATRLCGPSTGVIHEPPQFDPRTGLFVHLDPRGL